MTLSKGSGGGGGAGKAITLVDTWNTALTGPVTSVQIHDATDLTHDNAPLMRKAGGEQFTLANTTAAPSAAAPSLMLDGAESFSLNVATANMEYKEQFASAGAVTRVRVDGLLMLNDGAAATAMQEAHLQATGDVTSITKTTDLTLTPNDPATLASDTQDIEAAGSDITLTVDDTVHLNVDGMELTSHTHQTESGDVISDHLEGESSD
jgi:hypothetical protein